MKAFAVLAFCAASVAANGYGSSYGPSQSYGGSNEMRSSGYGHAGSQEVRSGGYGGGYGSQTNNNNVPITMFNHDIRGSESNNHRYETGNGISVRENTNVVYGRGSSYDDGHGRMVQSDSTLVKEGHYSYTSPEGQRISTGWSADENGFRASGDHLPRPVEMPAEHAEAHRQAHAQASGSSYGGSSYSYQSNQGMRSSGY